MRLNSVHIGSLTVRLQPEYNVIVISNFQLSSLIGHPTENPCIGGSIPSLAINRIRELRPPMRWPFSFTYTFTYTFTIALTQGDK